MTERPTPNYSDAERELRRVEGIESAKMQDRTRAIVDAAERLARAMNLDVSPHGYARYDLSLEDGLTPEADDALLVLARALALPAEPAPAWTRTPPSEPGWWFWREWCGGGDVGGGHHAEAGWIVECEFVSSKRLDPSNEYVGRWAADGREWWPVRLQEPPA